MDSSIGSHARHSRSRRNRSCDSPGGGSKFNSVKSKALTRFTIGVMRCHLVQLMRSRGGPYSKNQLLPLQYSELYQLYQSRKWDRSDVEAMSHVGPS